MDAYSNQRVEEVESLIGASLGFVGPLHPGDLSYLDPEWVRMQSALAVLNNSPNLMRWGELLLA